MKNSLLYSSLLSKSHDSWTVLIQLLVSCMKTHRDTHEISWFSSEYPNLIRSRLHKYTYNFLYSECLRNLYNNNYFKVYYWNYAYFKYINTVILEGAHETSLHTDILHSYFTTSICWKIPYIVRDKSKTP